MPDSDLGLGLGVGSGSALGLGLGECISTSRLGFGLGLALALGLSDNIRVVMAESPIGAAFDKRLTAEGTSIWGYGKEVIPTSTHW